MLQLHGNNDPIASFYRIQIRIMEPKMKPMIYATVATITLVTANFAFAGNCATHSAEAVKCDLAGKAWDEATSTCNDPSA